MTDEFTVFVPFTKISDEDRIIAGYASVAVPDEENDLITLNALREALPEFMKNPIIRYMHEREPIGKVIPEYKGHKTEVNHRGLFVVCIISKTADRVWTMIKEGILKSFSVAGQYLKNPKHEDHKVYEKIVLREISVVDIPTNPHAIFTILKSRRSEGGLIEEEQQIGLLELMYERAKKERNK